MKKTHSLQVILNFLGVWLRVKRGKKHLHSLISFVKVG